MEKRQGKKKKKVGETRRSNGKLIDIDAEVGAVLRDGLGEHEGAVLGFFLIFVNVVGAKVDAGAAFERGEEGGGDAGAYPVGHSVELLAGHEAAIVVHRSFGIGIGKIWGRLKSEGRLNEWGIGAVLDEWFAEVGGTTMAEILPSNLCLRSYSHGLPAQYEWACGLILTFNLDWSMDLGFFGLGCFEISSPKLGFKFFFLFF